MKVWLLDPAQLTPYYNIALCDALANSGCDVRYITSKYLYDDALPSSTKFKTDYLYFRGLYHRWLAHYPRLRRALRGVLYPLNHWQLIQQIRHDKPDIIHIQWSRLPRFDNWLIQQAHDLGVPVVHTVHDVVPLYAPESSVNPLQQVYKNVDAIIVHAQANERDFVKIYDLVNPQRIHIIPHINLLYKRLPSNASREQARQLLKIPTNVPVFLFFGSIRHYKGLDILLTAFTDAVSLNHDIHLIVAGLPETPQDIALVEKAQTLVNCHVFQGYIPYENMWQYYMAADVAVLPYRTITQSAALMTAMEFGQAVIVTNVGGLPETVEGNGWIVEPENPRDLTNAIIQAAENTEQLRQMGQHSKALAELKYSGEAIAQQTITLYQTLMTPQ